MAAGVEIKDLSFSYGKGQTVLDRINLSAKPGEKIGIIGPSGAGKSTLLLHLNGILAGEGEVRIGDLKVHKKNLPEIRRQVGLLFQNPDDQLFNPTVEEDVVFGPRNFGIPAKEIEKRLYETLSKLRLTGFEKRVSHHLSLGEKKRVALSTVLVMNPEVIALDEPFSSLDPSMIEQLIKIINSLEATLFIVSQSIIPLVACCDRIAILSGGKILKTGVPLEIVRDGELLRACGLDMEYYFGICKKILDYQ
ncbi:MAG: ABC transporter ATP-binding protein [Bacteroidales bacterium]